uniref:Tetratricopeptide repeat protein n=1 Tax=candidate division WOR-3 bacterium TaxID=2052148 RepID=A0A7C4TC11_UNCW3
MAEQDFSEIAKLSERYQKEPKSRIFVQLADAYRKNNMIDEALEVLNQGLQYHPQYPLAYLILGKCHLDKRQFAQAKEAFEKTIQLDPLNIVALRLLVQVCDNLKDEKCLISAYQSIITIDPTDQVAKEKLAALEAQSRKPVYTITLAEEYERQGNLEEALKVYENLAHIDPQDIVIQNKIKELKTKLKGEVSPKVEEKGVEELHLETYFKPEDLATPSAPPPPPEVGIEIPSQPVTLEPSAETPPLEPKPVETQVEEILSMEELLVRPEEGEPKTEKEEFLPIEEITTESAILEVEKPVEQPIQGELIESTPPAEETPKSPEKEEVVSLQEFLQPALEESKPEKEEVKGETPEIKEEIIEKPEEPKPAEVSETKPAETAPEEPKKEEKKEEVQKPKEEDFKSFQDWLSSLLK